MSKVKAALWLPDLEGVPPPRMYPSRQREDAMLEDFLRKGIDTSQRPLKNAFPNFSHLIPLRDMVVKKRGQDNGEALEDSDMVSRSVQTPNGTKKPPKQQRPASNLRDERRREEITGRDLGAALDWTRSRPAAPPKEKLRASNLRDEKGKERLIETELQRERLKRKRQALPIQVGSRQETPTGFVEDSNIGAVPRRTSKLIRKAKAITGDYTGLPVVEVVESGYKLVEVPSPAEEREEEEPILQPVDGREAEEEEERNDILELTERQNQRAKRWEERQRRSTRSEKEKAKLERDEETKLKRRRREEVERLGNEARAKEEQDVLLYKQRIQKPKPLPTTPTPIIDTEPSIVQQQKPKIPLRVPIASGVSRDVRAKAKIRSATPNPVLKNLPAKSDVRWVLPSGDVPAQYTSPPPTLDPTLSSLGAPPLEQNPLLNQYLQPEAPSGDLFYSLPESPSPQILGQVTADRGATLEDLARDRLRSKRTKEASKGVGRKPTDLPFVHPGVGGYEGFKDVKKTSSTSLYRQNFVKTPSEVPQTPYTPKEVRPNPPTPLRRETEFVQFGEPLGDLRQPKQYPKTEKRTREKEPERVETVEEEEEEQVVSPPRPTLNKETKRRAPPPQPVGITPNVIQSPGLPVYIRPQISQEGSRLQSFLNGPPQPTVQQYRPLPEGPKTIKTTKSKNKYAPARKGRPLVEPRYEGPGLVTSHPVLEGLYFQPPQSQVPITSREQLQQNWRERYEAYERDNPTVSYYEVTEKPKPTPIIRKGKGSIAKKGSKPQLIVTDGRLRKAFLEKGPQGLLSIGKGRKVDPALSALAFKGRRIINVRSSKPQAA